MIGLRASNAIGHSFPRLNKYSTVIKPKTGIVMLNMGGPEKIEQVGDFLYNIMTDGDIIQFPFAQNQFGKWIAQRRTAAVQKKYQEIGGGSPILKWTKLQGKLLCNILDQESPQTAPHKPYVAFRYVTPLTEHAFSELERDGIHHAILFSQFPQYSCATSGSSFNEIYKYYKNRSFPDNLRLTIIDRWPVHKKLAECFADNIRKKIQEIPQDKHKDVIILFSAHSLPLNAVNRGDSYPTEVGATVYEVLKLLDFKYQYQIVWQSKVGPQAWLGPQTDETIKNYVKQGKKSFVIVPIAFVNEHIETLHELDIEYCQDLAKEVGVEIIKRVEAPNDHPLFIRGLADIVQEHLQKKIPVSPKFLQRCPHCINPNCFESKRWYMNVCKF